MMILNIHVPGATPYEIGDEIWQESLTDAIRAEAQVKLTGPRPSRAGGKRQNSDCHSGREHYVLSPPTD